MIYVLLGKTCSGKTTVLNHLVEKFGVEKIVQTTTRPQRENEVDGSDYHFTNTTNFFKKIQNEEIFCVRAFQNFEGRFWYYGIEKQNVTPHAEQFLITDPKSFLELKNSFGNLVVGIYMDVPNEILMQRGFERKDNKAEFSRRLLADVIDFKDMEMFSDVVITNTDLEQVVKEILKVVEAHES